MTEKHFKENIYGNEWNVNTFDIISILTHMSGDEALHGSYFTEKSNLVDLCDNSIQYFSFEGSKHDGFILKILQGC